MQLLLLSVALSFWAAPAAAAIAVVAAENVYGEVAQQLVGPQATVTSILSNPEQDPHLFEVSASVARAVAEAQIVVVNGARYDPWMDTLLAAHAAPGRLVVTVADLLGSQSGGNPHLWYDPATIPAFARAFAAALDRIEPAHTSDHAERLAAFLSSLRPLEARIAEFRAAHAGVRVTATEPVFGSMAKALGLTMCNEQFQLAVMNETEPAASDIAALEDDLRGRKVRALIYNTQATGPAVGRLLDLARASNVPVVGVTETQPAGTTYAAWMTGQLDALDRALSALP